MNEIQRYVAGEDLYLIREYGLLERVDGRPGLVLYSEYCARVKNYRDALEQLADNKGAAGWTPEEVRQIARTALEGGTA